MPGNPAAASLPAFTKRSLKLNAISDFISNPAVVLRERYGWGKDEFNGHKLIEIIHKILSSLAVPISYKRPVNPTDIPELAMLFLVLKPKTSAPKGLELTLDVSFPKDFSLRIPFIFNNWFIKFDAGATILANTSLVIQPNGQIDFNPPSGSVEGRVGLFLEIGPNPGATEIVLVGEAGASRLAIESITAG